MTVIFVRLKYYCLLHLDKIFTTTKKHWCAYGIHIQIIHINMRTYTNKNEVDIHK